MTVLTAALHFVVLSPWLTQQVTGQPEPCGPKPLGMTENAFDDQYEGCIEEMEKKAPRLLKEEMASNANFKNVWVGAEKHWQRIKNTAPIKTMIPKSFHDSHGVALVAYTGHIAEGFNKAIREFGQNPKNFHFKAFHYYLMRALQLLSKGQCYTVYRGCRNKFQYSGSGNVRFGQFTSTSLKENVAHKFSGPSGTLFTIETCLGVYIKEFAQFPGEEEVLIPGYELYQQVTENQGNFLFKGSKKGKSKYNCYYVSSANDENKEELQNKKELENKDELENSSAAGMLDSSMVLLLLPGFLLMLLLPVELRLFCWNLVLMGS